MPPTARSPATLPISCGVVRASTRSCSTAARSVLGSARRGSVSRSRNGRAACRRSSWKTADPELAVARGAALFGKSLHCNTERIEAGAARAVFLEVFRGRSPTLRETGPPSYVCVLPRGASSGQRFEITGLPLEVQVNCPARFQAYYSTRRRRSKAGDIVDWSEEEHHALPPWRRSFEQHDCRSGAASTRFPSHWLPARTNWAYLQVSCVSADPLSGSAGHWNSISVRTSRMAKTFRSAAASDARPSQISPRGPRSRPKAHPSLFSRSLQTTRKLTATRLLKSLEQIMGMPKSEWNAALVRALWPALESCMARRKGSADHEEAWLILAGFLLRPGFGAAADHFRIDSLWRLHEHGLYFAGKRARFRNTFSGGGSRAASNGNVRSRSSHPSSIRSARRRRLHQNLSGSRDHSNGFPFRRKRNWLICSLTQQPTSPARTSTVLPTLRAGPHSQPGTTICRTRDSRLARSCGASLRGLSYP